MATFKYISKDMSAKTIRGTLEADDRNDLVRKLKEQNLFLVSCQDVTKKTVNQYKMKSNFPFSLVNNTDLEKQVELFYLYEFWLPLKGDLIANQVTADSIFDFSVNAGIKTSVLLVQSIIGTKTDGIIGEKTLQKLNSLDFGYFQPAFTVGKITH